MLNLTQKSAMFCGKNVPHTWLLTGFVGVFVAFGCFDAGHVKAKLWHCDQQMASRLRPFYCCVTDANLFVERHLEHFPLHRYSHVGRFNVHIDQRCFQISDKNQNN